MTTSFCMVIKNKTLTDKMCRREIPPTYSVKSPVPPTTCCWFFAECCNAWPYISYGQCQLQLEWECCVKEVNKANSSPSKAVSCYFYHCSACIIHASMNFSTPVTWHSAMRLFIGDISRLSEASLVCVFSLCLQLTRKQGSKSIDGYWTHNDCCLYDDYGYHGCIQKMLIA